MTRSVQHAGKLSNPLLISPNLFNEFLISVPSFYALVLLRLDSVHLYTVLFFFVAVIKKKSCNYYL